MSRSRTGRAEQLADRRGVIELSCGQHRRRQRPADRPARQQQLEAGCRALPRRHCQHGLALVLGDQRLRPS